MLSLRGWCCAMLLLSSAMSAPVEREPNVLANVNEVSRQEAELESLLGVAEEEGQGQGLTVHEESQRHLEEVNGQQAEVDTQSKTVSDSATGRVVSEVKQEVIRPDVHRPEVEVKTEVEVPAEGIHKTIVQEGLQEEESQPSEEEEEEEEGAGLLELSPESVAAYLYRTGDFVALYKELATLVNASLMTEEEAESYSQLVAMEYERLQMEDYQNIMVQRRMPQAMEPYPVAMDTPDAYPSLALERQQPLALPLDPSQAVLEAEGQDLDPYDLLSALWSEAYGAGDVRAQALVAELFQKVRADRDPDDQAQVRDILLDLLASSVLSQEPPQAPRYGWQPIAQQPIMPVQPISIQEPLPVQPISMQEPFPVQPISMQEPFPAQPISMQEPFPVEPISMQEDEEAANELMAPQVKRTAEVPSPGNNNKAQPTAEQVAKEDKVQPMVEQDTSENKVQPMGEQDTSENKVQPMGEQNVGDAQAQETGDQSDSEESPEETDDVDSAQPLREEDDSEAQSTADSGTSAENKPSLPQAAPTAQKRAAETV